MLGLRTILVPIDFSGRSQAAVGYAAAMAGLCRSRLIFLHALPAHLLAFELMDEGGWISARALEQEAHEHLVRLGKAVSLPFAAVTRWGDRAGCIAAAASQTGAGLIVMASARVRRLSRFLHRSLTGEVLKQAACPVLILSQPEGVGASAASYRHIACAVESAGRDEQAIQWAAAFAQLSGSELTVIRCGPPPPEVLTAARRFRCIIDVGAGSIHRAAAAAVEELRPDLLVVGRALSTVRQLAMECRCPVVSVREPGREQPDTRPAGWRAA